MFLKGMIILHMLNKANGEVVKHDNEENQSQLTENKLHLDETT